MELDFLLSRPDIMSDMAQFMKLSREHSEVAALAGRWARFQRRERDLAAARELLADADMADLARDEIAAVERELTELEAELQRLLQVALGRGVVVLVVGGLRGQLRGQRLVVFVGRRLGRSSWARVTVWAKSSLL